MGTSIKLYGESMKPTFQNGQVGVTIDITNDTKLNVGDVVSYTDKKSPINKTLHRIFKIENGIYYMRGDNPECKTIDKRYKMDLHTKLIGVLWIISKNNKIFIKNISINKKGGK